MDKEKSKEQNKRLLRRPRPVKNKEEEFVTFKPVASDFHNLQTPPTSAAQEENLERLVTASSRKLPKISKSDKKWVLDSDYQSRKSTAFTANGKNLLRPYKARGPDALAPREVKKQVNLLSEYLGGDEDIRYAKPPLFTLNDFTMRMAEKHRIELSDIHKIILSSANYKKITELVAKRLNKQYDHIAFVDVDLDALDEIEDVQPRVPPGQVLFEMAALIKDQVKESLNFEVECKVKKLPKFAPGFRLGEAPHSEIVLFERQRATELERFVQKDRFTGHPTHESLFTAGPPLKHFHQTTRSASPFTHDEQQITAAEICVLDCLLTGGIALSLKASFIDQLPDISVLQRTLTYVNLSYNDFKEIPQEILLLSNLQILKLRNNPISILPADIHQLQQLESLIVSFCCVSVVPISLYSLPRLKILDLSYNRISFIHREVASLKSLRYLNLEGNELSSLPNTLLKMQLRRIKVRNNFLHPLMWKENSLNQVQQLQDLAAIAFYQFDLHRLHNIQQGADGNAHNNNDDNDGNSIPLETRRTLVSELQRCECCGGAQFGRGLRLIRPARQLFGVRYLPLLFTSCSPRCRENFLKAETELPERLYASDGDLSEEN